MKTSNYLHQYKWLLAIVIGTSVVCSPSLDGDWLNRDDVQYVLNNPMIQNDFIGQLGSILTEQVMGNYHPLTILSLKLDHVIHGNNPFGYHVMNIILHMLGVTLVFILTLKLFEDQHIAIIVSSLFAIHPMHIESVAWVAARKDVLYVPFMLLGMIQWLKYIRSGYKIRDYILTMVWFLLAVLSKPMAVIFPIVLILIDYHEQRILSWILIREKAILFGISLLTGILAIISQQDAGAIGVNVNSSVVNRIFAPIHGFVLYIGKLLLPIQMSPYHPYPDIEGIPWPYVISLFIVIGLFYLLWKIRSDRVLILGAGIFICSIFPVLQILSFGNALIAERYSYFSYLGLFIIVAILYKRGITHEFLYLNKLSRVLMPLFILSCAVLSYQRCKIWLNSDTLWSDVIEKYPAHYLAYGARGNYWAERNQYELALADYSKSIELHPGFPGTYTNRGQLYRTQNKWNEALKDFNQVIRLDSSGYAFLNRGILYKGIREFEKAEADLTHAIFLEPSNPAMWAELAALYSVQEDYARAITHLDKAIKVSGENPALYFDRGHAFCMDKQYESGIDDFTRAIQINPDYAKAYYNRSRAYYALGQTEMAESDAITAMNLGFRIPTNYSRVLGL